MVHSSLYLFASEIANGSRIATPDRMVIRALAETALAQSRGDDSVAMAQESLSRRLEALGRPALPKVSGL
jgi:hypothetical protein